MTHAITNEHVQRANEIIQLMKNNKFQRSKRLHYYTL